jgi:LmbE family N-acetylglucosaminyl deacetylase
MLLIAAHPDDEDTGLLTLAARGLGADAAYLSLTRGEGGQNLIGSELGVALGLVRTQELLAARAVDGARQYFTRAFDFGFTRDLAETEGHWPADSVLKDVVRVVRRFRPHVIVSTFSGTSRDGHGQHQMAGVMARRAFDAAGDPAVFPELRTEEGLETWSPHKLYTSARFRPEAATLRLDAGAIEPRAGRTIDQIAMESRSKHRSQDFGVLQAIRPAEVRLALERARVTDGDDDGLFAGVPAEPTWLTTFADSLRRAVAPRTMGRAVPALAAALARVRHEGTPRDGAEEMLGEALIVAAQLLVDARAGAPVLVPGEPVPVDATVLNGGATDVVWRGVDVAVTGAGTAAAVTLPSDNGALAPGVVRSAGDTVMLPLGAAITQPYFTARPLRGALYDWTGVPPAVRGAAVDAPALTARFDLVVAGVPVTIAREVSWRERNQAIGEVRAPLQIAPRVDVVLDPDTALWRLQDTAPRMFTVTVRLNGTAAARGLVRLAIDGWGQTPASPLSLPAAGAPVVHGFAVRRPEGASTGAAAVRAEVVLDDGSVYGTGAAVIAYPHIRPLTWMRPAASVLRLADAALPEAGRIGYVRGAADRVPEALRRAGLPLTILDAAALEAGDLTAYDVVVIGSRAYETDSALVRANGRLLDWVRAGGHLVVQYQQYPFVERGFAPFRLTIARPHDRVTDETSPVTLLAPGHPAFNRPNTIAPADWDGWPQERGLYFAGTWDPAYAPLLELRDPGREPVRGGLLVARVGRGSYVYTGLSFFRALPAGVPGAFRLFFNLLDLGETMDRGTE